MTVLYKWFFSRELYFVKVAQILMHFVELIFVKMINDQTMEPHGSTTQLGVQMTLRSTKSVKIVPLKKPLIPRGN